MLKPRQIMMKRELVANSNKCNVITALSPGIITMTGVPSGGIPSACIEVYI